MKVSQVYSIVNSIQSQLFGETAVAVTDTTGLRALGEQISASNLYDKFVGTLVDRIGKTIVRTLDTKVEFPGLMRNEFEFGAMLQKINFDIPAADENAAWNIADPNFTPDQFDVTLPVTKVIYFKGTSTWRVRCTVPDEPLLNSAFTSAQEMLAFINGITDSMEKSMIEKINAVSLSAISAMIAEKADLSSASYINLLDIYNNLTTPAGTMTAAEALQSPEFLRWASAQIDLVISYMDTPSVLYNEAFPDGSKIARRTTRDNMHIWLHSQYAQAAKSFMEADTFNRELVTLPYYKEIKLYQGSGTTPIPAASSAMQINVKVESGDTVKCDYVIGCFADREAIGIGKYQVKTASDRNNIDGYTNYASMANIMHYIDLSENVVVFALADPVITQPTP